MRLPLPFLSHPSAHNLTSTAIPLPLPLRAPSHSHEAVSLPVPSLSSITTTLHRSAALKSRLHLLLAALSTLRSDYPAAEAHLAHAVRVARAHADAGEADDDDATETETESDLAGTLAPVALAWALVRCARAAREGKDEREAQRALEAVLDATARGPRPTTAQGAHMRRCAALSLLLLRLGNPGLAADGGVTSTDALARLLTSSSSSALPAASSPSSPAAAAAFPPRTSAPARLATALASALTVGSITASKTALSQALTLTNQMGATHARAGVLALLANVFLWTREGEVRVPSSLYWGLLAVADALLLNSPLPRSPDPTTGPKDARLCPAPRVVVRLGGPAPHSRWRPRRARAPEPLARRATRRCVLPPSPLLPSASHSRGADKTKRRTTSAVAARAQRATARAPTEGSSSPRRSAPTARAGRCSRGRRATRSRGRRCSRGMSRWRGREGGARYLSRSQGEVGGHA